MKKFACALLLLAVPSLAAELGDVDILVKSGATTVAHAKTMGAKPATFMLRPGTYTVVISFDDPLPTKSFFESRSNTARTATPMPASAAAPGTLLPQPTSTANDKSVHESRSNTATATPGSAPAAPGTPPQPVDQTMAKTAQENRSNTARTAPPMMVPGVPPTAEWLQFEGWPYKFAVTGGNNAAMARQMTVVTRKGAHVSIEYPVVVGGTQQASITATVSNSTPKGVVTTPYN